MLPQVKITYAAKTSKNDDERINTTEVNLFARMKKVELDTWKSTWKAVKHKLTDKIVEMKDDRSLFARMMIVAWKRPAGGTSSLLFLKPCLQFRESF